MDSKAWWQSKTIWGAAVTLLAVIAGFFGVAIDSAAQLEIQDAVVALVGSVGSLLTVYGRFTATKEIR